MRHLAGKWLTTHEKKEKKNTVSLFAGFWLMTGLKGGEWGSTRGHPGDVAKRRVWHNKQLNKQRNKR
jgi:hypothetical protein